MNPMMARSPEQARVSYLHCKDEASRLIAPTQDGYCYLRMLQPASWARVARVLGPNPSLHCLFGVALADLSLDQLARLQLYEVGPGLLHLADGDGSALIAVARTLSDFSRLPASLATRVSAIPFQGLALQPHLRIGGSDVYSGLRRSRDSVLQRAVSQEKPVVPVVYMAGGTNNSRVEAFMSSSECAETEARMSGVASCFDKFTFPPMKHDTVMLVPGNVAVRSGHVQIGGRGRSFALVVPQGRNVTAYRFGSSDLTEPSLTVDMPVGAVSNVRGESYLTSHCGGMSMRAAVLSSSWSHSYAAVDRYDTDHRFALSHGTEFYVRKWCVQHHHGTYANNATVVDSDDDMHPFKNFDCVCSSIDGLYRAEECMHTWTVALTDVKGPDHSYASLVLNDLVVTLGEHARVSFSMDYGGYHLTSTQNDVTYRMQMVGDDYGYDCEFGSYGLTFDSAIGRYGYGRSGFPSYGISDVHDLTA